MLRIRSIIFMLLILLPFGLGLAKTLEFQKQCGEYKFIIKIVHPEKLSKTRVEYYYQEKNHPEVLFYKDERIGDVTALCIEDKNNAVLLAFGDNCQWPDCVNNAYGLFDPKQKRLLVEPIDLRRSNALALKNVLGYIPDFTSNTQDHFCCSAQLGQYRYDYAVAHNTRETQCGGNTYVVKGGILNDGNPYEVYYKSPSKKETLLYKAYTGYFDVACIEGRNHQEYLVMRERCSGSGCTEDGEYYLIDAQKKKLLLKRKPFIAEDEKGIREYYVSECEKEGIEVNEEAFSTFEDHLRTFNHQQRNFKDFKKILGFMPPEELTNVFCCPSKPYPG